MYEVTLRVVDTASSASTQGLSTQQTTPDDTLLYQQWLPNVWREAPRAHATASVNGTPVTFGKAPLTVDFDASSSDAPSDATYLWDFGDGTTATGQSLNHTFGEGEFVVTLTVTDSYGQSDTHHEYVVARSAGDYSRVVLSYPSISTASLGSASTGDPFLDALIAEGDFYVAQDSSGGNANTSITTQQLYYYNNYFPYVLHQSVGLNGAVVQWGTETDPVDRSLRVTCTSDNPLLGYINGENASDIGSLNFTTGGPRNSDQTCWQAVISVKNPSSNPPPQVFDPRTNNEIEFDSNKYNNKIQFDVFSGLRVPQIHLSVLSDQMLPGDLASPYVTATSLTNPDTGVEELVHFVRIRESEAENNTITFDVPVYAVNDTGNLVEATGLFNARVPNLPAGVTVDCGDCVMVDGEGTLTVTLEVFGATPPTFDLTNIELFGGVEDCTKNDTSAVSEASGNSRLRSCTQVTASYEVPSDPLELEEFGFTSRDDLNGPLNTVSFGNSEPEREAFFRNFGDTSVEVVKFGVSFLPLLGDGLDLGGQFFNTLTGRETDPVLATLASAGLILDVFTGGVGDVTTILKGGYKISLNLAERGVGGTLAITMRDQVEGVLIGTVSAGQFVTNLSDRFTVFLSLASPNSGCGILGFNCWGDYDRLGWEVKSAYNETADVALQKLDDTLESDVYAWERRRSALDDLAACPLPASIDLLADILTQQTNRRTLLCPNDRVPRTEVDTGATSANGKRIIFARPESVELTIELPFETGRTMSISKQLHDAISVDGDQRCHIIASMFGGSGGKKNYFPCNGNLNQGRMRVFEEALRDYVRDNNFPRFTLRVDFTYPSSTSARPDTITYTFLNGQDVLFDLPDYGGSVSFSNPVPDSSPSQ